MFPPLSRGCFWVMVISLQQSLPKNPLQTIGNQAMLFNQELNQLDKIATGIQSQIEQLQAQLTEVQNQKQSVLGVEQMWESAISQLEAAKLATLEVCPHLLDIGIAGVRAVFSETIALPESSVESPHQTRDTEPPNNTINSEEFDIEVETSDLTSSIFQPSDILTIDSSATPNDPSESLTGVDDNLTLTDNQPIKLTPKQKALISKLSQTGSIPVSDCTRENGYSRRTIASLIEKGLLKEQQIDGEAHYQVKKLATSH